MSEPRRWSDHPLVQLTRVRYREFFREPEAVFWVFVFPILLAAGLGIAFRNRAPERTIIGVVAPPGDTTLVAALRSGPELQALSLTDSAAAQALRTGDVVLVVSRTPAGGIEYRYDETRPESRTARLLADEALQRAEGRQDPVPVRERLVQERGARYIDFLIPGLLGMNLMGSGIWGLGFAIVDARKKRLLKRLIATPMSRWQYLASFALSRLTLLFLEVGLLLGFAVLVFGVPMRGSLPLLLLICLLSSLCFRVARAADCLPGPDHGGRIGSHEPGDAPDVDLLRGLLLGIPLSRADPAVHSGAAAHGGDRCAAGEHASGRRLAHGRRRSWPSSCAWMVVSFVLALKLFRWR